MGYVRLLVLAGLILGAIATPAQAAAETYWVSTRGSDDGSGTRAEPFRTVARALAASDGGETINVLPGRHMNVGNGRNWTDTGRRRRTVTVRGVGGSPAILQRLVFNHATGVRLERLRFEEMLTIFGGGRITVAGNEFTGMNRALELRGGARHVAIERNWFHHAASAITGPPAAKQSSAIRIEDNLIEDMRVDGIQFGNWDDVTIEGNVIRRLVNPLDHLHNDGIQMYGNSARVRIARNTISESRHQGILIGNEKGPIDDLLIESNVVVNTGAIALYSIGVTRMRIVGNTIWRHLGSATGAGIVLRNRGDSTTPSDVVIANNIASRIATYMPPAVRDWNLVGSKGVQFGSPREHEMLGVDPLFGEGARLLDGSPARDAGNPAFAPALDRDGRPRDATPSIGAYE